MRRTIPNLSALALAVTAGCSKVDPAVGDWDATFFSASGYNALDMPYQGVRTNQNGVYDYFLSLKAKLTEGGTGVLTFDERFEQNGTVVYESTDNFAALTEMQARGVWWVEIPSYDGMLLECTARGNAMSCLGDDAEGVDYDMDFVRREE